MLNGLNKIIAFGWIKNETARKCVRLAFNVGLVFAASTPAAAPILAVLNLAPSPEAGAIVSAVSVILEAVRNTTKPEARP